MPFEFSALHPNILTNLLQFIVDDKEAVLFVWSVLEEQRDVEFPTMEDNINSIHRYREELLEKKRREKGILLNAAQTNRYLRSGKARSRACEHETMLIIENNTDQEFDLHWLTYEGQPRHNGKIHRQNNTYVSTYATHPFLVCYPNNQLVCCYISRGTSKSHILVLNSDTEFYIDVSLDDSGELLRADKTYEQTEVEGFRIHFEPGLFNKYTNLHSCLEQDLHQIVRVLPSHILSILQTVPMYINEEFWSGLRCKPIRHRGMCYHAASKWLVKRGLDPAKARSIEIFRVVDYLDWRRFQPWNIFHEYSHAYHHFIGDFRQDVVKVYERAMQSGKYDRVQYTLGGYQKHYGASNVHEYFAENSEAFFGINDYYPYNRQELKKFDPLCYKLLKYLWNLSEDQVLHEHERFQHMEPAEILPSTSVYHYADRYND